MADILNDMRKVTKLNGDTYSSAEVLGMISRGANEIERLHEARRHFSALADAKGKENVEFRQLLRDARDHVPWDVLKRIDAALGASRAEQEGDGK